LIRLSRPVTLPSQAARHNKGLQADIPCPGKITCVLLGPDTTKLSTCGLTQTWDNRQPWKP
jgi:hypothetical protein